MRAPASVLSWLLLALPALAGSPEPGSPAPPLAPVDVRERALLVPVPGRVTLLSFASPSTGEAMGEIARALRVEHPELEIVSFIDLSSYPGFTHGLVRRQIAKRQDDAVAVTRGAFARAGKQAPEDLDARIHIVPDFDAVSFVRYGAAGREGQPRLVLIGADGRIAAIFAGNPRLADVKAALAEPGIFPR